MRFPSSPSGLAAVACCCWWSHSCAFVPPTRPHTASTSRNVATNTDRIAQTPQRECARLRLVGLLAAGSDSKEEGIPSEQEPMDLDLGQMFEVFDEADKKITDEEVGIKSEGGKKSQGDDKDNPAWSMIKDIFAPGSPSK